MTSILFFTTSARDTKVLNDEIKRNGGFKNASSLEPLKKEYNLTPMASLTDISDETLKFFYRDFLEFYREKHYFYDVSNDDEMTYFLIHTAGKLLKTAFPLMLKSLLSGGKETPEGKEIQRQNAEIANLSKQYRKYVEMRNKYIVAMVV